MSIPKKGCAIYALVDPETDLPRYVGCTSQPLVTRLRGHLSTARISPRTNSDGAKVTKDEWISSLASKGKVPRIRMIQRVGINAGREHESYWTWRLYLEGAPILNFAGPSAVFSKLSDGLRNIVPSFKKKVRVSP